MCPISHPLNISLSELDQAALGSTPSVRKPAHGTGQSCPRDLRAADGSCSGSARASRDSAGPPGHAPEGERETGRQTRRLHRALSRRATRTPSRTVSVATCSAAALRPALDGGRLWPLGPGLECKGGRIGQVACEDALVASRAAACAESPALRRCTEWWRSWSSARRWHARRYSERGSACGYEAFRAAACAVRGCAGSVQERQ
jgi:hypothetical protein